MSDQKRDCASEHLGKIFFFFCVGSSDRKSLGDRAFPRDERRIEKEAPMKKALYGFPQLQ